MTTENPSLNMGDEQESKKLTSETSASPPAAGDAPTQPRLSNQDAEDASVSESGNQTEKLPDSDAGPGGVSETQGVDEQNSPEQNSSDKPDNPAEPSSSATDDAQNPKPPPSVEEQRRAAIAERLQRIKAVIEGKQQKYKQIEDALQQDNLDGALQAARESGINLYDPFAPFEKMKREWVEAQEIAKGLETVAQNASRRASEIQEGATQAQKDLEKLENLDEQARSKADLVRGQLSNAQRQLEELEKLVRPAKDDASQINDALQTAKTDSATLGTLAKTAQEQAQSIASQRTDAQGDIQALQKWVGDAQRAKESIQSARDYIENVIKREMALRAVQNFETDVQQSPSAWMNTSALGAALEQLEGLIEPNDETSKRQLRESLQKLQNSLLSPDLRKYGSTDKQATGEWVTYFSNWLKKLQ